MPPAKEGIVIVLILLTVICRWPWTEKDSPQSNVYELLATCRM